jgi:glycine/D-amino acid oxidase-like deaminating enzyme
MQTDIAVIGGGVMGSALGYWLTELDPTVAVTVIERDPAYTTASSALSAASIRQQFTTAVNIRISRESIGFLRHAGDLLAVERLARTAHAGGERLQVRLGLLGEGAKQAGRRIGHIGKRRRFEGVGYGVRQPDALDKADAEATKHSGTNSIRMRQRQESGDARGVGENAQRGGLARGVGTAGAPFG